MSETYFGKVKEQDIKLFTLKNKDGLEVRIMNYGATITAIILPDGTHLSCGFDNLEGYFSEDYKQNAPYFGCTVGRFSSRIKNAEFTLHGERYKLAANNGKHNLHGGINSLDKEVWEVIENSDKRLVMSHLSPHMSEGFPGNVQFEVIFELSDTNELSINYLAVPDKDTPISLTNHTYFNLSGFKETIEGHYARVNASRHLKPDESGVPAGEAENLEGLAADLSEGKQMKQALSGLETGFEHYFIFDKPLWQLGKIATFEHLESGRKLEISTTEPGMLFYSGYFTSNKLKRENGDQYGQYMGFCCETHRYPNGPNIKGTPGAITKARETYTSQTIYSFSF